MANAFHFHKVHFHVFLQWKRQCRITRVVNMLVQMHSSYLMHNSLLGLRLYTVLQHHQALTIERGVSHDSKQKKKRTVLKWIQVVLGKRLIRKSFHYFQQRRQFYLVKSCWRSWFSFHSFHEKVYGTIFIL